MSEEKPNIYQRINAVMKEVEYVKKDKDVDAPGQKYKAVTHDNVTAVLRPHLVNHGIVVQSEQLRGEVLQFRDVKQDRKMHLYSGDYAVHFVNVDKPDDRLTVTMSAHAADNGDKAPGKSCSYAVKYAMLKTFSLETGEDEEGRYHETPPFTDLQKAQFHELVETENAMGLACFEQEVGPDAMVALNSTFPKGKVSEGKKQVKALTAKGWDTIRDYAEQISARIAANDPSVLELTGELEGSEKRIVANLLSDSDLSHLRNLRELGA